MSARVHCCGYAMNAQPVIALPPIPSILSEWAAIIPLVTHLASLRDEDSTIGEIALLGRLSIGLFPKLGFFMSLQKLLTLGSEFIDQASFKGDSSRTVWDINWGSVFPCANTAATASIMDYVLHTSNPSPINMPTKPPFGSSKESSPGGSSAESSPVENEKSVLQTKKKTMRTQNLHVLQVTCEQSPPAKYRFRKLSLVIRVSIIVSLILASVPLVACGAYGTATVLIISAISRGVCLKELITRPMGYMRNNETHEACMLVANHENSAEWYLFTGDRSVVDTLLNKPMIHVAQTYPLIAVWFGAAHIFQIGAMTFTAAHKGWDAIALVTFVFLDTVARYRYRVKYLVRDFLAREGIHIKTKSFRFTGRTILMGSIQLFSNSKITSWMDNILVPHPRRDAILEKLKLMAGDSGKCLPPSELEWVEFASSLIKASADIIADEFLGESV